MLVYFLHFRLEVVTTRLEYELAALQKRPHILEGFEKIFDALDDILKIVRKSEEKADAAQPIMKKYDLGAEQLGVMIQTAVFSGDRT
jgi:DNA gyrase subunit A